MRARARKNFRAPRFIPLNALIECVEVFTEQRDAVKVNYDCEGGHNSSRAGMSRVRVNYRQLEFEAAAL